MTHSPSLLRRALRAAFRGGLPLAAALACLATMPACEEFSSEGDVSDDALNGRITETEAADAEEAVEAATESAVARDVDGGGNSSSSGQSSASSGSYNTSGEIGAITWKGKNVSGWPVTTTLRASVSGGTVKLNYDKAKSWPVVDGVCANAWAIVNIGGKWYAGTFEYLRPGQTSKPTSTLDGSGGDHFKTSPLSSWRPQSGEVFGLMVSGLCRGGLSNVQERSNICIVRWP